MEEKRKIIYYKHYFEEFFEEQDEKTKEKIDSVLFLITVADRIPIKFFKHIESTKGLYEIRVESGSNIYRLFCCFDKGNLVVLFNGFQKKKQKTPPKEIVTALKIMKEYFQK